MSRNNNLRKMSAKLPPYPLVNGRKIQRDGWGQIIYVNHFREFKKIQHEMAEKGFGPKSQETLAEYIKYSDRVMTYAKAQKPRSERIKSWLQIAGFILILVIAYVEVKDWLVEYIKHNF